MELIGDNLQPQIQKVVTPPEATLVDKESIETYGVESRLLMGWAGYSAFTYIRNQGDLDAAESVHVFTGTGNNSGDGFVISWHIITSTEKEMHFWMMDEPKTPNALYYYGLCRNASADSQRIRNKIVFHSLQDFVRVADSLDLSRSLFVDAIFGIGFNKPLREEFHPFVEKYNRTQCLRKYAVDIPSGVYADGSIVSHPVMKADVSITFGAYKPGHLLEPGIHQCGDVRVFPIGFYKIDIPPKKVFIPVPVEPLRTPEGNKYRSGVVHILGGSSGMEGAAILSGVSFLKTGGGLAKIYSTSPDMKKILARYPQLMIQHGEETDLLRDYLDALRATKTPAIAVMGPGLSVENMDFWKDHFLPELFSIPGLMAVLDASLLSRLSAFEELIRGRKNGSLLLTPHKKEAERLLSGEVRNVRDASLEIARRYNTSVYFKGYGGLVVLKNEFGNPEEIPLEIYLNSRHFELSTGGSGDIFTGMAASSINRGIQERDKFFWNEPIINQAFTMYFTFADETLRKNPDLANNSRDWFFPDMGALSL